MNAVEKIDAYQKFGSVLGLTRMTELMKRLGNPEKGQKYIHVAGTNGKGSVCRFIYSALLENGYSVGIYSSPYLTVFNERIEADGEMIADADLERLTDVVIAAAEGMTQDGFDSPTEFEIITAIAFLWFAERKCDYVVLEVGLGGRGDSTNVIEKPLVSVITSISYDHTDRLGSTLTEIAGEKAGIIKPGVPVVSNVTDREAARVIARTAYENGSVLHDVTRIRYGNVRRDLMGTTLDTNIGETEYRDLSISMLGDHQIGNAMTALATLELLRKSRDIKIERSRLYKGFDEASNIGRFEIMSKEPYVILDGAHNEAGAAALAETMKFHFEGKKVLTVMGVLADKDYKSIIDSFCSFTSEFIAVEPANPRKLAAGDLAAEIVMHGKPAEAAASISEAIGKAFARKEFDVILFAGSLYLIGEIRGRIEKNETCGK